MTFVNYFADETRQNPLNAAVARVLLSGYVFWKLTTYVDWTIVREWPVFLHTEYRGLILTENVGYLTAENGLALVVVCLFAVGYRMRLTGFLAALLIAHLSAHLNMLTTGGTSTTYLYPVYLLLLFALFAEKDPLSVDGLRDVAGRPMRRLNDRLASTGREQYSMPALKWALVAFGLIYFQSGITKVLDGPLLAWTGGDSLQRYLTLWQVISGRDLLLADLLRASELLAATVAWGTVVLEVGFIVAILLGAPITLFVLGLGSMHAGIAIAMTPFFFDMFLLYLVFVPWDTLYARIASAESVEVAYDDDCRTCLVLLQYVRWLDINETITFVPLGDEASVVGCDAGATSAIFLVTPDGEAYEGYDALKALFDHFRLFAILAWLMSLSPVAWIGTRVYRHRVGS